VEPRLSDDGLWWWNGRQWVPSGRPAMAPGLPAHMVQYATFWMRAVAVTVDSVLVYVVSLFLTIPVAISAGLVDNAGSGSTSRPATAIANVLNYALYAAGGWLYWSLMESSRHQATLGNLLMGIRVVDSAGNRVSFLRATGRFFAKYLSALLCWIGYFVAGFTPRKQALHDLLASTYVVRAHPAAPHEIGAPEPTDALSAIGVAVAAGVLLLTPIVVIVILLTMGGQLSNVFSNVVVALNA